MILLNKCQSHTQSRLKYYSLSSVACFYFMKQSSSKAKTEEYQTEDTLQRWETDHIFSEFGNNSSLSVKKSVCLTFTQGTFLSEKPVSEASV